jgi:hypothetical protein
VKADEQGNVQWEIHFVDSTIVRAHQDAAGAKKRTSGIRLLQRRLLD